MHSENNNPQEQVKKAYDTPEMIEHGTVEEITGTYDDGYGCSGKTYRVPD